MASKFELNRYNWFGQKLLTQHNYNGIIDLHKHLAAHNQQQAPDQQQQQQHQQISEHLSYLNCLALMKTTTRLDEVIYSLQRLNFDKNSQYFLLLCQCLLYSGNYDSVVALCRQVINRQIDGSQQTPTESQLSEQERQLIQSFWEDKEETRGRNNGLEALMHQESFEFKRIFSNISANNSINEPRLWIIFGQCLEYQHQYRDAQIAYRMASSLVANDAAAKTSMSYVAHQKYADSCIRLQHDFRAPIQTLGRAYQLYPQNYTLNPLLALAMSAQPAGHRSNLGKAMELIGALEAHSVSTRNPSQVYNDLALKCMRKLQPAVNFLEDFAHKTRDEARQNLSYHLIKSFIVINNMVQQDSEQTEVGKGLGELQSMISNQADKLIDSLRRTDTGLWESPSIWNNLGLCYLAKKRFIASLSCLLKAHQTNPLDWRINFNLALVCVHVGLVGKALTCLLAAKSLYSAEMRHRYRGTNFIDPLITVLIAISFEKLNEVDEARRLFIETTTLFQKGTMAYVLALVNYLVFLHKNENGDDEQQTKLKLHLLDQLEQCWLQRDQNSPQFNRQLLDSATQIANSTPSLLGKNDLSKKTFAWVKFESFMSRAKQ